MKEATGELTTTVIVVAAIGLVSVAFTTIFLPMIQAQLVNNSCETACGKDNYTKIAASACRGDNKETTCVCTCGKAQATE